MTRWAEHDDDEKEKETPAKTSVPPKTVATVKTPAATSAQVMLEDLGPTDYAAAGEHERRISVHGVNYEHVGETAEGVWIYRHM